MGPRIIPSSDNILLNKQKIPDNAVFLTDLEKETVSVNVENKTYQLGEQLIYFLGTSS